LVWQASWHSGNELFQPQAMERDRRKRQVVLHQRQRLMHERAMHAPLFEPVMLHGVGPRVEAPTVGMNARLDFAAPYEEIRLKQP
jgi:peptide/nickel transport system substrate-binding protein